ncbi:MAG: leucine-rich repeat domain-containing protein [Muribaculaceae bacterium]|nr:leucine-rich repeat domain-containing protein [Muribaculaceae bacterium]
MRIRYSLFLGLVLAGLTAQGETFMLRPGELSSIVRNIPSGSSEVAFSGSADSQDLLALKNLPKSVTKLDISQLDITQSELPPYALMATNVQNVSLPTSLKIIGEGAFAESSLVEISLPPAIEKIGERAFYKCRSLRKADLADVNLSEIPEGCFYECLFTEGVSLPQSLRMIGDKAFMRSGIKEIAISQVSNIGNYAFAEMPELTGITISKSALVGEGAFFNDPQLTYLSDLPANIPALGFAMNRGLTRTARVESEIVKEGAFAGINSSEIVIGKDVREIEQHAFSNARNLISINAIAKGSDVPTLHPSGFSGVDVSKVELQIAGDISVWREAEGWKDFNIVEKVSSVENLNAQAGEICINCEAGMVTVSSVDGLDSVAVYSIRGMVLWQTENCGDSVNAGPFADKEVIVQAVSGDIVKVGKYIAR